MQIEWNENIGCIENNVKSGKTGMQNWNKQTFGITKFKYFGNIIFYVLIKLLNYLNLISIFNLLFFKDKSNLYKMNE